MRANPSNKRNPVNDRLRDWVPIPLIGRTAQTVVEKARLPVRHLAEFDALAGVVPSQMTAGTSGNGRIRLCGSRIEAQVFGEGP